MKILLLIVLLSIPLLSRAEQVEGRIAADEVNGLIFYDWRAKLDPNDDPYTQIRAVHVGKYRKTLPPPGAPSFTTEHSDTKTADLNGTTWVEHPDPMDVKNLRFGTYAYCSLVLATSVMTGPGLDDLPVVDPFGCNTICYDPTGNQ